MMTQLDKAFVSATKNQDSQSDFYNLFLNTDIFIPTYDIPQNESQKRAGLNESIKPIIVESEGISYLMLFDTKDKLSAWAQREVGFVALPGHAVVEMMGSDLHWALNAGTEYTKIFVPEEIMWLKESVENSKGEDTILESGTKILIGVPSSIPPGLVDSLKNKLIMNPEVLEAYLGQVHYVKEGEKPHLALVLRLNTSSKLTIDAIRKDLSIATRGFLSDNEYIDFHLDDGGTVSTEVIKAVDPFYVRSN